MGSPGSASVRMPTAGFRTVAALPVLSVVRPWAVGGAHRTERIRANSGLRATGKPWAPPQARPPGSVSGR